ncbi:hypothetical protein EMIT0324P_250004 [Pseudomonas chlororaphis]
MTLSNIEGVIGGAGNDNLTAHSAAGMNSLLDGRGGGDTYTVRSAGHTLLTFPMSTAATPSVATAMTRRLALGWPMPRASRPPTLLT